MDIREAPRFPSTGDSGILVVDDDFYVLKSVERMVRSLGYEHVYPAASSAEALRIWNLHEREIRLVISDFVMPDLTGDRLASDMLSRKPSLKILLISGNDPGSLDSVLPLERGVNFLQKPFSVEEMRALISSLSPLA
jgi:DNA-binding NtrC family response regulator